MSFMSQWKVVSMSWMYLPYGFLPGVSMLGEIPVLEYGASVHFYLRLLQFTQECVHTVPYQKQDYLSLSVILTKTTEHGLTSTFC